MFYFYQLPVPRLSVDDTYCKAIATRAARLICVGLEFDKLRRELLGDVNAHVAIEAADRKQLQREIDGLVAHLYNLSEQEFNHVLNTFPRLSLSDKDLLLETYRTLALEPDDLALAELIDKGENDWVEFKEAACWNARLNRKDDSMRDNVIQEVAAFLNSREGGVVLIGVEDDGNSVGLEGDYKIANQQKQNRDGYRLFLLDHLKNNLAGNYSLFYKISFGKFQGKDVCRIDVAPSSEPVFIKGGDFYIREGNRKRKLSPQETFTYSKQRFT